MLLEEFMTSMSGHVTVVVVGIFAVLAAWIAYHYTCRDLWLTLTSIQKTVVIVISIIVAATITEATFFGALCFISRVEKDSYIDKIKEGERDRLVVQEFLVQRIPELNGVDSETVVFDRGEVTKYNIVEPSNILVTDKLATDALDNYFEEFKSYDYKKTALSQFNVSRAFLSGFLGMALGALLTLLISPAERCCKIIESLEGRKERKAREEEPRKERNEVKL